MQLHLGSDSKVVQWRQLLCISLYPWNIFVHATKICGSVRKASFIYAASINLELFLQCELVCYT